MVVVSGALLLARQTASRRLSAPEAVLTVGFVQASSGSSSVVAFTVNVRVVFEWITMGAAWPAAKTTMSRPVSMVCGKARAATGVPEKETSALGLAAVPEVSRI